MNSRAIVDMHPVLSDGTGPSEQLKINQNLTFDDSSGLLSCTTLALEGDISLGSNSGNYRAIRPLVGSNTKLFLASEASTYTATSIDMDLTVMRISAANTVNRTLDARFLAADGYSSMLMTNVNGTGTWNGLTLYNGSLVMGSPTSDNGAPTTRMNTAYTHTTIYSDSGTTYIGLSGTSIYTNAASNSISDGRCKRNAVPVDNALSTINKLNIQKYDKGDLNGDIDSYQEVGMIAQQVDTIPELQFCVSQYQDPVTDQKLFALNYQNIHNIGLKAIQELSAKIEVLQARIAQLEGEKSNGILAV